MPGALDDLKAAGFSDDEVNKFGTEKRQALLGGGFSTQEADTYLGRSSTPSAAQGNRSLALTVGNALNRAWSTVKALAPVGDEKAAEGAPPLIGPDTAETVRTNVGKTLQTVADVGSIYGPIETALHAATAVGLGFPAYLVGSIAGLSNKYLMNGKVDPAELASTMQELFTYHPQSETAKRLTATAGAPFQWFGEKAEEAGHKVTDVATAGGASVDAAAAAGAVTSQTIQMIAPILGFSLMRRMAGYAPDGQDIRNTAKVLAEEALPKDEAGNPVGAPTAAAVNNAEASLRTTYEKTGIDPLSVTEAAKKDPSIMQDLVAEGDAIPSAIEEATKVPTDEVPTVGEITAKIAVDHPKMNVVMTDHPGAAIELNMFELRDLAEEANKGYGRAAMADITRYADLVRRDMLLIAHPAEGSHMSLEQLAAFYEKNGFYKAVEQPYENGYIMFRDAIKKEEAPSAEEIIRDRIRDQPSAESEQQLRASIRAGAAEGAGAERPAGTEPNRAGDIPARTGQEAGSGTDVVARTPEGIAHQKSLGEQVRELSLEAQRAKGWNTDWPFIPADLQNSSFREAISRDPELSAAEKQQILSFAPGGKNEIGGTIADVLDLDNGSRRPDVTQRASEPARESPDQLDLEKEPAETAGKPTLDVTGPTAEETRIEGVNSGIAQLNAGIPVDQMVAAIRDSYSPYVGVEMTKFPRSPIVDALFKVISPSSRGPIAKAQAGIMRHNFGDLAHEREVAMEKLEEFAAKFDRRSLAENYAFIDAMEKGTPMLGSEMRGAAQAIRALLDQKRDQVIALGKGQLENFDENYFPHIWKDKEQAVQFYGKRPLTGSGSFLKQRYFDEFRDGLRWRVYGEDGFKESYATEAEAREAAGPDGHVSAPLTPITDNPVEMALLKAREMDRYIYGQKIFQEMKDAELAKFIRFGDKAPVGYTRINDKIARVFQRSEEEHGMILRGEYYAPDEAATLINNHLSPGLQGNGFYDAWRGIGNVMNSMQLGMSLFHVGFTTMDAMVSKVALGVKQMGHGNIVEGATNVAQGLNPVQPFLNLYKGDKLLRAYLGKLDSPELAPIVDTLIEAGGRVRMDDFYRNATVNAFKQALRRSDVMESTKQLLPTLLDRINAPIFEHLVPRQKLGVFFDMAKDYLEHNHGSTIAERRAAMGDMWDSVDNRMGLLVYDNVFWNHVLKDGLMASVRSVGWNLGTFRELGGGVLDLKNILSKGVSDRTAYVVALPLVTAVYGSILNYLYTGEPPKETKDAFFPKTGRIRPDGTEDRVSLPTYMKDVYAYGEDLTNFAEYGADPTQTLKNKTHPMVATISQMLANQDFYGALIRNPADPAVTQIKDEANYIMTQMEPFSLRNYKQQAKLREAEPGVLDYVTSPSMVGVTPAPGYMTKSKEQVESSQVSRLRDGLMAKYRQELKDGGKREVIIPKMLNSGLTRRDIVYVLRTSGEKPAPHRLRKFGNTSEPENEE